MQLARHSSPILTGAVYGRARLQDLAGAVDRLPSLGSKQPVENDSAAATLKATGTDGKAVHVEESPNSLLFPCRAKRTTSDESERKRTEQADTKENQESPEVECSELERTDSDGDELDRTSASCRARTYDPLIMSLRDDSTSADSVSPCGDDVSSDSNSPCCALGRKSARFSTLFPANLSVFW